MNLECKTFSGQCFPKHEPNFYIDNYLNRNLKEEKHNSIAYIHTIYIYTYTYIYTAQSNICPLNIKEDKNTALEGIQF